MKILAIYGTRPEFLKIKPILAENKEIKSLFIKQHTDIINFGNYDYSLEIENSCQNRLNSIFEYVNYNTFKFTSNIPSTNSIAICNVSKNGLGTNLSEQLCKCKP